MVSLAAIPALRAVPRPVLEAVAGDTRGLRFAAGAVVRPVGAPAEAVVLLLSGTLVAVHLSGTGGEVWPERWVGPAIADKQAVLAGGTPTTGLTAATAGTARLLPRRRFLWLLEEERSVREHVLAQLARDAVAGRRRLVQAVGSPAAVRVAAWLLAQDPADPVAWRGSQEELGRMLGLSRVTVNRALARLATAGALRVTAVGVVVADRSVLATFGAGS